MSGGMNSSVMPRSYCARTAAAGGRFAPFPAPKHDRVPGFLCPVPAPIAIHRKISADDSGDLRAAFRQSGGTSFQKAGATSRRSIPPIRERVHENVSHAGGVAPLRASAMRCW